MAGCKIAKFEYLQNSWKLMKNMAPALVALAMHSMLPAQRMTDTLVRGETSEPNPNQPTHQSWLSNLQPNYPFTPDSFGKAEKKTLQWIRVTSNKTQHHISISNFLDRNLFPMCASLGSFKSLLLGPDLNRGLTSSWDQTGSFFGANWTFQPTQGLHQKNLTCRWWMLGYEFPCCFAVNCE